MKKLQQLQQWQIQQIQHMSAMSDQRKAANSAMAIQRILRSSATHLVNPQNSAHSSMLFIWFNTFPQMSGQGSSAHSALIADWFSTVDRCPFNAIQHTQHIQQLSSCYSNDSAYLIMTQTLGTVSNTLQTNQQMQPCDSTHSAIIFCTLCLSAAHSALPISDWPCPRCSHMACGKWQASNELRLQVS